MLAFWAPPTPSRKPRKSWKWWKRPARHGGLGLFNSASLQRRSSGAQVPSCSALPSLAQPCTYLARVLCPLELVSPLRSSEPHGSGPGPRACPGQAGRARSPCTVLGLHRIPWDELDETSAGLQILGRLANCNGVLREWLSPGSTCPETTARTCWTACPSSAGAGTPSPCALICSRRWPSGSTSSGASTPQRTSTGAQLARGRGALRQAGHQQPRGFVRSKPRISVFHEDLKPSGGWGGLQLAPDLHGCGRGDALGPLRAAIGPFMTTSWGPSTSRWRGFARLWRRWTGRRYLKCIKTDCLVMQDVPNKYRPAVERLLKMSHRDGTPVYRYEQVTSGGPRSPLPGRRVCC